MTSYILLGGVQVKGSIHDLSQRHVRFGKPRVPHPHPTRVWLGDEPIGWVKQERRYNRCRECWRWVGYTGDTAPTTDAVPVGNTIAIRKSVAARALAVEFLLARAPQQAGGVGAQ